MLLSRPLLAQYLTIAATMVVVDVLVMFAYTGLASRLLGWLRTPRQQMMLNRTMSGMFALAAVVVVPGLARHDGANSKAGTVQHCAFMRGLDAVAAGALPVGIADADLGDAPAVRCDGRRRPGDPQRGQYRSMKARITQQLP